MVNAVELFSDLVGYQIRVYNAVDQRLRAEHGLVTSQYEVLRLIGAGHARTVGEIATSIPITVGAASKSIDRLEARGWVARSPNPHNRRSSLLGLTTEGARLLAVALSTVEQALQPLIIEPLSECAATQFGSTLARLRQTLDEAGVGSSD